MLGGSPLNGYSAPEMMPALSSRVFCAMLFALVAWCLPVFAVDEADLSALLEEARAEAKMPSLRAAVRFADGRLVRAAAGLGDVEAGIPLDNEVGMPGGSTGKTFVAVLTMLLVEDGTLSLDDPAAKWLGDQPWFRKLPNSDEMRVRHLLSHTAGIGDYPGRPGFLLAMVGRVLRDGSAYFTPEELIRYAHKRKALFPAGDGYRYSDVGYLVLGKVIEAATGRTYFELLDERVLTPLQLDGITPADRAVLSNIVPSYTGRTRNLKKDGRMKLDPRSEWTGGGLVTNPTMLVEFYGALAEGRVVNEESLALMLESGFRGRGDSEWHYGFGVFVHRPSRSFGHAGRWSAYRSHVAHFIDRGLTAAVQTNHDGGVDLQELVVRIARMVKQDQQQKSSSRANPEPVLGK